MNSHKDTIPRLGKVLLWLILNDEDYPQILGDFEESYRYRIKTLGMVKTYLWIWAQLLKSIPRFISDSIYWRGTMFKNYLKTAFRVIKRQKLYSLLNIVGLAVSLTCGFLILLHVKHELSYETNFPKADRIYRVLVHSKYGSNFRDWAASAPALGPLLEESFPEIEAAARIRSIGREILSYQTSQETARRLEENHGFIGDSSFLIMFDLEFISGNPQTALQSPNSVVLTSALAKKYFSTEDPIGKTLMNESRNLPLKVTGIIQNLPKNTHLRIDYLVSMSTIAPYLGFDMNDAELLNHRTWKAVSTYVLLRPNQSIESFYTKAPEFMTSFLSERPGRQEELSLQPIRRIHLHSKLEGEIGPNSDISYVYIFSAAAFLLLLISAVNFINLSTAQSFKRTKEIGIRKVVGARRGQIIKQYLGEAFMLTSLSTVLTLILLNFILPFYNQMSGKDFIFRDLIQIQNIVFLLLMVGILSLLSGLYPAFFASTFRPVNSLKTVKSPRSSAAHLRKGLVIFQFIISIFMIFGTITIYRQLVFFHSQDLGFDKDKLIALRLYGDMREKALQNTEALKTEILRYSGVNRVALASSLPGTPFSNERLTPVSVSDKNKLPMLRFIRVDEDFIQTAGLEIVQGRNFDRVSDQKSAYIISESVVEALNLEQPLGVECRSDIRSGTAPIVGVIKDFHFASLHNPIEPLVLEYNPTWTEFMLVKAQSNRFAKVLVFLERTFAEIAPHHLFSYLFVDEVFNRNYENENRGYDLFKVFSVIALIVACLGLFGLTVYAAETRIKEIGIRKVLGASVPSITVLLSREFIRWVLIANIIAWPAAYFAMNKWLENFAYRVHIHLSTFVISAGLVLLLALATVSYQAIKAATANPSESLRCE